MSIREKALVVKAHVVEHKIIYISVGSGVIIGIVIGIVLKSRPTQIVNTVAPIFNNYNSSNVVSMGGYVRKIIKCNETGDMWESLKDAADSAGVSQSVMSKHVNKSNPLDHIYGKTYTIVGIGTAA